MRPKSRQIFRLQASRKSNMTRLLVLALVWWTGRLPMAVPDFHDLGHHHESNASCILHEHLNRWHADTDLHDLASNTEVNHKPLLHWHLLMPGLGLAESLPKSQQGSGGDHNPLDQSDAFLAVFTTAVEPHDDAFSWLIDHTINDANCLVFASENTTNKKILEQAKTEGNFWIILNPIIQLNSASLMISNKLEYPSTGFRAHLRC